MRRKGNYPNSGNHPASPVSDTFFTEELNGAIAEYQSILDKRWEGYRDKTGTIATVANTATAALPADLKSIRAKPYILVGSTPYRLSRLNPSQVDTYYGIRDIPSGYLLTGDTMEFFPTPNAVYTVNLRYTPTTTVLVSGSDSIAIPNGWERFVIDLALRAVDQQQNRSVQDRLAILALLEAEVVDTSADRDVAGPEYIPFPGEGVVPGFGYGLP